MPAHIVTSEYTLADGGNEIIFNTSQSPFDTSGERTMHNILVNMSIPNPTALDFVSGTPIFTSIPSGNSATDIATLSITTGAGLQTVVRRISNNLSGPYLDIADYTGRFGDTFTTSGGSIF